MSRSRKETNVAVFVRVRPMNEGEENSQNVLNALRDSVVIAPNGRPSRSFHFSRVFGPEATQVEVYNSVTKSMIYEVLSGYNCTIFAYGPTGTGKTYTMEGANTSNFCSTYELDPLWGIIPRASDELFNEINVLGDDCSVRVSYVELYNEDVIDLLSSSKDISKLKIFDETLKKGSGVITNIQNLTEVPVNNKRELLQILEKGSSKRQKAHTLLNANSSRSHTIFTITVVTKEVTLDLQELLRTGKLNLVDLAGSENVGRSGAVDKRAREAANINQSLLTLSRVISSIVTKASHIPYRESKLTRILQDSLGGNTRTSMIATISPSSLNMEDTLSTLEYASQTKRITNHPTMNVKLSKEILLKSYSMEISQLKKELQAAREKEGVHLSLEQYQEMKNTLCNDAQELMIKKKELLNERGKLKLLEEERNEIKMLYETAQRDYIELHNEVERKRKLETRNISKLKTHFEKIDTMCKESKLKVEEVQDTLINPINIVATSLEKKLFHIKSDIDIQYNGIMTIKRYLESKNEDEIEKLGMQKKLEEIENSIKQYNLEMDSLIHSCLDSFEETLNSAQRKSTEIGESVSALDNTIQNLVRSFKPLENCMYKALMEASKSNERAKACNFEYGFQEIIESCTNLADAMQCVIKKAFFWKDLSKEQKKELNSINFDATKESLQTNFEETKENLQELSQHNTKIQDDIKKEFHIVKAKISENIDWTMDGKNTSQKTIVQTREKIKEFQDILKKKRNSQRFSDFPQDKLNEICSINRDVIADVKHSLGDVENIAECSNNLKKTRATLANSYGELQAKVEHIGLEVAHFVDYGIQKDIPSGSSPEKQINMNQLMRGHKPLMSVENIRRTSDFS